VVQSKGQCCKRIILRTIRFWQVRGNVGIVHRVPNHHIVTCVVLVLIRSNHVCVFANTTRLTVFVVVGSAPTWACGGLEGWVLSVYHGLSYALNP
jgi:hypothetical protein